MDEGSLRCGQVDGNRVDQQEIGLRNQLLDSSFHGETSRLEDIDVIDFVDVGGGDSPSHGALANALGEDVTPVSGQNLAIAESTNRFFGRQDDCRREDRAEEGAASGFVDSGNEAKA